MINKQIKAMIFIGFFAVIFLAQSAHAADWVTQTSGTTSLNNINMLDAGTGYAVGDSGIILKTTNGGQGWASQTSPTNNNWHDVDIIDANIAWVVGDNGKIAKTENGGATWNLVTSGVTTALRSIEFLSSETGFIVGSSGTILYTFDGGAIWTQEVGLTTQSLYDVHGGTYFGNLKRAFGVGANGTIVRFDTMGGWTVLNSGTTNLLQDVYVKPGTESLEVWIAANGVGTGGAPGFLKTTNKGASWSVVSQSVATSGGMTSVTMNSSGVGLAALSTGKILKTIDGGSNWTLDKDTGNFLSDIATIGDGTTFSGWIVGWIGKIVRYDGTSPGVVSSITQTSDIKDNTPTFTWLAASDDVQSTFGTGINYYEYSLDGAAYVNNGSGLSLTLSQAVADGTHTLVVRAVDKAANTGESVSKTFTIDTTPPTVGKASGSTSVTVGTSQTYSAMYSDNFGLEICYLIVNDEQKGSISILGTASGTAQLSYTFASAGNYSIYFTCHDTADNLTFGAPLSVVASAAAAVDTSPPTVPQNFKKISSDSDSTPTFTWSASTDNTAVTSYLIQIDDGDLVDVGNNLTYTTSTLSNGSHTIKVLAKDAAGNTSPTSTIYFSVDTTSGTVTVECSLTIGGAYKLETSPAVYYITEDCTKRPFTNPNIFFSYFDSWSDVVTISKSSLDEVWNDPLGFMPWGPKYDPKYGALVKIVSDSKVYLLLGTEKYWITSETVFLGLNYSWSWIEDVDKALLNKYTTGSEINYTDHHPNYTIVKYATSPKVYRLEPDPTDSSKQVKRHILNETVFNTLNFRWDRIVTIPATEVYKDGAVIE